MAAIGAEIAPELLGIETRFLAAWPALASRWDGSWVWRAAGGYTKRANAIQCQDPADDGDAEARLLRLAAWSGAAGIAPMFRQTPLAGPGVVFALDQLGWTPFEKSRILYLDRLADFYPVAHRVEIVSGASASWVAAQCALQGYDARTSHLLSEIIARMPQSATGLTVFDASGELAASVLAVAIEGLAMFTNVVTAPQSRRQGLGKSAMGAALNAMKEAGADKAAIHVLYDNEPARTLYFGFGFRQIGTYLYRKGPRE